MLARRSIPGGWDSKESACKVRDPSSIPGKGRSSGERKGYPFQYSHLENSMDRGAWWSLWGHKVRQYWASTLTNTKIILPLNNIRKKV